MWERYGGLRACGETGVEGRGRTKPVIDNSRTHRFMLADVHDIRVFPGTRIHREIESRTMDADYTTVGEGNPACLSCRRAASRHDRGSASEGAARRVRPRERRSGVR